MGGMFSSSSSQKNKPPSKRGTISDVDRAILDLKNARDRLTRYKNKLERDDAKLVRRAGEANANGKPKTALGLLRLRRYKQREMENVENRLLTVLHMVETIDSKQNEQELLAAMRSGKDALQRMHQETTVEDVLELMDQIQEQKEVEEEVTNILQGVPSLSPQDEAAVEAELEEMEQALLAGEVHLPEVPTSQLPATNVAEPAAKEATTVASPSSSRVAVPS